jgi:hypothetical protein
LRSLEQILSDGALGKKAVLGLSTAVESSDPRAYKDRGLYFDGADDVAHLPPNNADTDAVLLHTSFTVAAWFKLETGSRRRMLAPPHNQAIVGKMVKHAGTYLNQMGLFVDTSLYPVFYVQL